MSGSATEEGGATATRIVGGGENAVQNESRQRREAAARG
jgi:hypothetical protein